MAKLSDYGIKVDDLKNKQVVTIRGEEFPISFTMETMEYIADIYDDDYSKFEADMNEMLKEKDSSISTFNLKATDLKIMRALIYAMLKTGGLDEEPETIFVFLGMNRDLIEIYGVCMEMFSNQTFQVEDLKKSRKPQDSSPLNREQRRKRKSLFKKK